LSLSFFCQTNYLCNQLCLSPLLRGGEIAHLLLWQEVREELVFPLPGGPQNIIEKYFGSQSFLTKYVPYHEGVLVRQIRKCLRFSDEKLDSCEAIVAHGESVKVGTAVVLIIRRILGS